MFRAEGDQLVWDLQANKEFMDQYCAGDPAADERVPATSEISGGLRMSELT